MNRLKGMRCYLCGSMDFAKDFGVGWRQDIKRLLCHVELIWLDPTNKPTIEGLEGEKEIKQIRYLLNCGAYDEAVQRVKEIRHIDLRLVDMCDFMIVYLDLDVHSCGTYEELFWCNRMKKPVLIIVKQGKRNAPSWLFGTVPHQMIFTDLYETCDYLAEIASASFIDKLGRWAFFNLESNKVHDYLD